jgi:hypothetical protein
MIKVRILTNDFHTFEPYRKSYAELYHRGIELVQHDADRYDLTMVGSSLFQDKKCGSLELSTQRGLEYLSTIEGPYILVDGQDSHSVIGSYEVFKESKAIAMLKDTMLKDRSLYKQPTVGGRWFWGKSENWGVEGQNYIPAEWDKYSDKIYLSGKNWLSVQDYQFNDYKNIQKFFDLSLMFQYPHAECHEFDIKPSQDYYYNEYRKQIMDKCKDSPFMISKLYEGQRLDPNKWAQYQSLSKVILSPFGYGAYGAPRDIMAVSLGSVLLKESLDFLDTYPHIYEDGKTYIACKNDFSDLEEKIEYCVLNFPEIRDELVDNMINAYKENYTLDSLADYTLELFINLNIIK